MLSAVSQYKNTPLYCPQVLSSITTTLAPNNMPDPRLLTIEENDYSGVDTTADAWHIPPSYFEVPKSPVQEVPSSPSSPYECHSPLAHELEDHSRADSSAPAHLKCDISCTGSSTCRHRSSVSEHPFHRRRKSALPQGVWTSIADIKEMAVDANIANRKHLIFTAHFSTFVQRQTTCNLFIKTGKVPLCILHHTSSSTHTSTPTWQNSLHFTVLLPLAHVWFLLHISTHHLNPVIPSR